MQQSVKVAMEGAASADIRTRSAQRLRGLDALRGLAALSVVLYHYTTGYEAHFGPYASRPLFYLPDGHFGVELFFCISGFVILGTLEQTGDIKRFFIARFARIYPAYIVCALVSLAAVRLANFHFPGLTAKVIALNATMLTGLTGVQAIDPSYWTLSYEVLFYAGAGLIWLLMGVPRQLEWPCLAWLCCSLVGHWADLDHHHHRLAVLLNTEYANLFVLGMMFYYMAQGSQNRLTHLTLGAALLMSLFPPEFNGGHLPQPVYVAMILSFGGAIWLVFLSKGKFFDIKPLVFLGDISYSLYLIHQMLGFAIIRLFVRAGVGTNAAILFTIALIMGVAFSLRTLVEKPAERWIKSLGEHNAKNAETQQSGGSCFLIRTRVE